MTDQLLQKDDFPPVIVMNPNSVSPLVFCCDHAGAEIPSRLNDLGVSEADLDDHIAIDSGIFATTCWVAGSIDAPVVAQPFSRLVIDCNRNPENPASIRTLYDGRHIPGNFKISLREQHQRSNEILAPYQDALGNVLRKHAATYQTSPVLVAMHSFARVYGGQKRDCDIGVIYSGEQAFARNLFKALRQTSDLTVLRNEPYEIDFEGDFTLPFHTKNGALPYVELEICQDLISTCAGQRRIARLLRSAFLNVLNETGC